ncbi:hypothetical protein KHS38_01340 [Mucilaginibacter sp. Bleaf8]|uniref:hypothetical protein n=1 Tax=Mucilaginibacter sp. Bleaf8 TaxID=2834430 RepID=UPI001BCE244F|nr:hypothetical protein [Mucilaginibacter sp. Bleaf8]MBS7563034.1 hypothetical protein [Mucilaginibacter sp. Bleaf8]
MKIKAWIAALGAVLALLSCNADNKQATKKTSSKPASHTPSAVVPNNKTLAIKPGAKVYSVKSLPLHAILINGLKPMLPYQSFQKQYPKPERVSKTLWECGSPFDVLDKDWMIHTYGPYDQQKGTFDRYDGQITTLYVNGAEYATNDHMALLVKADAVHNPVSIPSHRIVLKAHTSIKTFEKLFPNLRPEKMEDDETVRYRISIEPEYDDAFLFYFKNGKFDYVELWFLLC